MKMHRKRHVDWIACFMVILFLWGFLLCAVDFWQKQAYFLAAGYAFSFLTVALLVLNGYFLSRIITPEQRETFSALALKESKQRISLVSIQNTLQLNMVVGMLYVVSVVFYYTSFKKNNAVSFLHSTPGFLRAVNTSPLKYWMPYMAIHLLVFIVSLLVSGVLHWCGYW